MQPILREEGRWPESPGSYPDLQTWNRPQTGQNLDQSNVPDVSVESHQLNVLLYLRTGAASGFLPEMTAEAVCQLPALLLHSHTLHPQCPGSEHLSSRLFEHLSQEGLLKQNYIFRLLISGQVALTLVSCPMPEAFFFFFFIGFLSHSFLSSS